MLNEEIRKKYDLRLDEIENALDSDDTLRRVLAVVGFAALFQELEPAISALEFVREENFDFGNRVMMIHDRIMKAN